MLYRRVFVYCVKPIHFSRRARALSHARAYISCPGIRKMTANKFWIMNTYAIQGFYVDFHDFIELCDFLSCLSFEHLCMFSEQIVCCNGFPVAWIVVSAAVNKYGRNFDIKPIPY